MSAHFRIAAITDEFSPDIEIATRSMAAIGMTGAELRMVFDKNILDLTDEELERAIAIVRGNGLEIISISSPILKCVLPDAPEVDERFQKDMFAAKHTFEDQPRLAARAFEIANRTGARIVRVFFATPARTRDRPVFQFAPADPHQHFRRCSYHLRFVELQVEHVR